jgi:hypothetical protein
VPRTTKFAFAATCNAKRQRLSDHHHQSIYLASDEWLSNGSMHYLAQCQTCDFASQRFCALWRNARERPIQMRYLGIGAQVHSISKDAAVEFGELVRKAIAALQQRTTRVASVSGSAVDVSAIRCNTRAYRMIEWKFSIALP